MNARSEVFELCLEGRQVQEAVSGIFHTLLFHRTQGKFQYKTQGRYSVGTVGFEDVTCDFIDFTYVRCASDELNEAVCRDVTAFSDRLRSHDGPRTGQIWLEFFQKKRTRWLLSSECIPWLRCLREASGCLTYVDLAAVQLGCALPEREFEHRGSHLDTSPGI